MTSTRYTALLFLTILSGILIHKWWSMRPVSLCKNLSCIQMDDSSLFRSKDTYSDTQSAYRALFEYNGRFLRIDAQRSAQTSAGQELDAAVTKIKAMFEKAPAPYPGEISDAIVCDPAFVPTYEEVTSGKTRLSLFVGYLNNRMTFGSCSQSQAVYRGALVLMHCPEQSLLIRTELIAKTDDFASHEQALMNQIRSLRCGK